MEAPGVRERQPQGALVASFSVPVATSRCAARRSFCPSFLAARGSLPSASLWLGLPRRFGPSLRFARSCPSRARAGPCCLGPPCRFPPFGLSPLRERRDKDETKALPFAPPRPRRFAPAGLRASRSLFSPFPPKTPLLTPSSQKPILRSAPVPALSASPREHGSAAGGKNRGNPAPLKACLYRLFFGSARVLDGRRSLGEKAKYLSGPGSLLFARGRLKLRGPS